MGAMIGNLGVQHESDPHEGQREYSDGCDEQHDQHRGAASMGGRLLWTSQRGRQAPLGRVYKEGGYPPIPPLLRGVERGGWEGT